MSARIGDRAEVAGEVEGGVAGIVGRPDRRCWRLTEAESLTEERGRLVAVSTTSRWRSLRAGRSAAGAAGSWAARMGARLDAWAAGLVAGVRSGLSGRVVGVAGGGVGSGLTSARAIVPRSRGSSLRPVGISGDDEDVSDGADGGGGDLGVAGGGGEEVDAELVVAGGDVFDAKGAVGREGDGKVAAVFLCADVPGVGLLDLGTSNQAFTACSRAAGSSFSNSAGVVTGGGQLGGEEDFTRGTSRRGGD